MGGAGGGLSVKLKSLLLHSSVAFTVCLGKLRFPLLLFGSSIFLVT